MLIVTDVYPAREEPIQGVDGEIIANAAKTYGHKNVHYIKDKKDIPDFVLKNLSKDDLIITLGAGDIYKYGEELITRLKKDKPAKKK